MSETISDPALRERARDWWRSVQPSTADGTPNPTGDRAAIAHLRRAAAPADAIAEDATLSLFRRLGLRREDYHRLPRVALIAIVLAQVRADAEPEAGGFRPPAARAIGRKTLEDEDSARMSALRFRRLLACRDDGELAQQMRRLVALADGRINVGDLAYALYYWNDEVRGDQIRTRWAFEYYAAGAAAPPDRPVAGPVEAATA